ncbi:MAG TPA: diaminopimelate epimerase [Planctomycetota bacterium]
MNPSHEPGVRLYSAAGNRFAVLDAFEREPEQPAELAGTLCARHGLDGLLVGARPRVGGDCRMLVYNRDGSRAEACGNGLRALARWALESEHAGHELVIETDAGPRRVTCFLRGREVVAARAELGVPRLVAREEPLALAAGPLAVTLVDMGNPHCIVLVHDVGRAEVATLGAEIECHPRFPARTNVSFVEPGGGRLLVRTWERGVGETAACGTGAGAAAVAAIVLGHARSPVEVGMRGGRLQVDWDGTGVLALTGPVEALRMA